MKESTKRWLWLLLYFLILLAPLIIVMIGPRPGPREFWRELSVALGFCGLALMGVQFIPTARLRPFSNLFSMDEVYYFHLRAALVGFAFVLAHPLILFLFNPTSVRLLNPLAAPARAVFGLVSLLALIGLVFTSVYRKQLNVKYEIWRLLHTTFAVVTVLTAMLHILGVDYYLSAPLQRILWVGLTVLWIGLIVNTRLIKPMFMSRRPYRMTEIRPERAQVWTLIVEPDGHQGIKFMPGQFAWLTIERPPFALRQHPFSIASSAESPERLEFTIAEKGDFTSQISKVPVGSVVYLDGPHGTFSMERYDGPGYVFIAGGIGSPPIMSMLRTMADRKTSKPAWLFYGNPTWESITYREALEKLANGLDLRVIHALENPPEDWEGEVGFINADMLKRHLPENRNELIYFICGPVRMITAVLEALQEAGVPLENVHTEQYDMV
jgi:predicted ferric reductase